MIEDVDKQLKTLTLSTLEVLQNAFKKQQKLPAWQPVLTTGTVLPTFFVIGIAFVPIGAAMMWFSHMVKEVDIDYTNCVGPDGDMCLEFDIDEVMEEPVFLYYGLTNFYQNHRRYVQSRSDKQLLGDLSISPIKDCAPFDKDNDTKKPYFPCGAIANSLFNDVIKISKIEGNDEQNVPMLKKEIAGALIDTLNLPKDWDKELWELDPDDPENNGLQNEDLMVWMRTAALPSFRKLYRRINHTGIFEDGLPKGKYYFYIDYKYRVHQFAGTKSVVLSTRTLMGGKNNFLGIAYVIHGCVCFSVGVVFLFVHINRGRRHHEVLNVSSRTPYN
ncbi:CDC50 family protein chat-1,Cell cycle control protein 50A,Cell cycle control protein 50B [Lepeophtheirus salmonis]|uniref:CDC50 family protein chat-1,Cell cycle control protein 50A,Cell cycle control protein 50B n=1 Tax=Lepeophtheirus salmonis TaxID=72036 RepID=A0A7R8D536_LEPSM|nr:CDC50 family protein chat-1,Cell cycle control protein 50A,Cell cycle control protein 50B [Lepeophtheirus salmonis]CAF3031091.1 CDC50 family protein chat-1,Cell cycle control protein 50A,Cell cycle control protein 50B [Lepeophtheirus salmonis]